jgi:ABC-type Zn uptake system ZnuABC Zn-binding protein ZnuA
MSLNINNAGFSTRVEKMLTNAGYVTLDDLNDSDFKKLLKLRGCGKKAFGEIATVLTRNGLVGMAETIKAQLGSDDDEAIDKLRAKLKALKAKRTELTKRITRTRVKLWRASWIWRFLT